MEVVRRQSLLLFHTYSRLVVGDWRFVVMMTLLNYQPRDTSQNSGGRQSITPRRRSGIGEARPKCSRTRAARLTSGDLGPVLRLRAPASRSRIAYPGSTACDCEAGRHADARVAYLHHGLITFAGNEHLHLAALRRALQRVVEQIEETTLQPTAISNHGRRAHPSVSARASRPFAYGCRATPETRIAPAASDRAQPRRSRSQRPARSPRCLRAARRRRGPPVRDPPE